MKPTFQLTEKILSAIRDVCNPDRITITTQQTDWRGRPYQADHVVLEPEHGVSFEVRGADIIIFAFDDHCHPADAAEAAACLRRYFTLPLIKQEVHKGRQRIRREWFFRLEDGRRESITGPWLEGGLFINPFARRIVTQTTWQYLKQAGQFVSIHDDTVEVCQPDWNQLITVRKCGNAFSYEIEHYLFYEEAEDYYWTPLNVGGTSFFESQEHALAAAKETARLHKPNQK